MDASTSTPSAEMAAAASLHRKMALVMADVRRVKKTGWNAHFGYQFATAEDVKDLIRASMAEHNLALIIAVNETTREPLGKQILTRAKLTMKLLDGDSGATLTTPWEAEGLDAQDKGTSKALTSGLKYFLINTFLVSTGDEPDAGDVRPAAPVRKAPPSREAMLDRVHALRKELRALDPDGEFGTVPDGDEALITYGKTLRETVERIKAEVVPAPATEPCEECGKGVKAAAAETLRGKGAPVLCQPHLAAWLAAKKAAPKAEEVQS